MIKNLYIENFILIDQLSLDFEDGFHAFLGETGAGKSILIDAISLLCADRASSNFVGKKGDRTIVEGTFDLSNNTHALKVLEEAGFEKNGDVTFTREITSSGKSTTRMNHRIVTLSLMKDILKNEIDIHGQRDTQYLLNRTSHIHLLDEYVNQPNELELCKEKYQVYKSVVDDKKQTLMETYNESDLEFLQYQLNEIKEANLSESEEEELIAKEKQFKAIKASYEKVNALLSDYDQIDSTLYQIQKTVRSFDSSLLPEGEDLISEGYYNLSEGMDRLRKLFVSFDFSEEEVNQIEERLFLIQRIKRKYGNRIEDIKEKELELEKQIERISHRQEYLEEIDKKIEIAYQEYEKIARSISKTRKKKSKELDQDIANHLMDLSLPNAQFKTIIEESEAGPLGFDRVEFYISMNKGEELKPLIKTASGGELSRLMLGLKAVFSKLQGVQTIIFDEIDTGVSGKVANAIGAKMKHLANDAQVFAVTHLAPVASHADHIYLVHKKEDQNTTITTVEKLNQKETIEQLALLASGSLTDASLKAAKELYEKSRG